MWLTGTARKQSCAFRTSPAPAWGAGGVGPTSIASFKHHIMCTHISACCSAIKIVSVPFCFPVTIRGYKYMTVTNSWCFTWEQNPTEPPPSRFQSPPWPTCSLLLQPPCTNPTWSNGDFPEPDRMGVPQTAIPYTNRIRQAASLLHV